MWNPYMRACAGLDEGDLVVVVPITVAGEPSWAVAGYDPRAWRSDLPREVMLLALTHAARAYLRAQGVRVA